MPEAFVILRHTDSAGAHYDLMLETGGVLATWRVGVSPGDLSAGQEMEATRLPDHRIAYLDREGPIGGGRGEVSRVDRGRFSGQTGADGRRRVELTGQTIRGVFDLIPAGQGSQRWRLVRRS